jgi:predicted nucleic acid-binding protein
VILLDTNVLSVLMKPESDADVEAWLNMQPAESMWTTSITVFEVRVGIEILESGRRRRSLEDSFGRVLHEDLEGRIVSFDEPAAQAAGRIGAERRRIGRSVEVRDLQIAGIAIARKAKLATRNIRHFEGLGVELVDPWRLN